MARKLGTLGRIGIGFAVVAAAGTALAVPPYLSEQGRLFDDMGVPVDATVNVTFSLYAAASGGSAVWTETQSVTVDDGYFSAVLGDGTAIGAGVFNGDTRYLGVKIGADPEMTPRQEITSVPYALVAQRVLNKDGDVVIDDDGVWQGPSSGLVGPTGPTGPSGANGSAGPTGPSGSPGGAGPTGPSGSNGIQGPTGPGGANGGPGPTGPAGANGGPGPTGPAGGQGPTGPVGPTGPSVGALVDQGIFNQSIPAAQPSGYFAVSGSYTPAVNSRAFLYVRCSVDGNAAGQDLVFRVAIRTPAATGSVQIGTNFYHNVTTPAANINIGQVNTDFFNLTAGTTYDFGVNFSSAPPVAGTGIDYCSLMMQSFSR